MLIECVQSHPGVNNLSERQFLGVLFSLSLSVYIRMTTLSLISQDACRYFLIESGFALFVAFLINVAVISVSGTVCSANNLSQDNTDKCNNLTLNSGYFLLQVRVELSYICWTQDLLQNSCFFEVYMIFIHTIILCRMCWGKQAQLYMRLHC